MRSVALLIICSSSAHGLPIQWLDHDLQELPRSQFRNQDDKIESPHLTLLSALLLSHPNMLRLSTLPRHQEVPLVSNRISTSLAMVDEDGSLLMPLFDPGSDRITFPIPASDPSRATFDDNVDMGSSPIQYGFNQPVYLNMLNAVKKETNIQWNRGDSFMGHCLIAGDGESEGLADDSLMRTGTIGVATRITNIAIRENPHKPEETIGILSGIGAFRFVISKVESVFPYPSAYVEWLIDYPPEDDALNLESEVGKALYQLVTVSRELEARGGAAEEADNMLDVILEFLDAHQRATTGGLYGDRRERLEVFSMCVCRILSLPYDVSIECISTRSAKRRFELLLEYLNPMLSEMTARNSVDALNLGGSDIPGQGEKGVSSGMNVRPSAFGGTTSFTPIDLKVGDSGGLGGRMGNTDMDELDVPVGGYVEYWWTEEEGWCKAEVLEKMELMGEKLHTLKFEIDGEVVENMRLLRWRTRRL